MERKLKHLELIQGVVNRLSTNSFLLKGWSVILVSAFFALSATKANADFIFLAYFPAFIFWGLDGFCLGQERLYRGLYDRVRLKKIEDIDFSMNAGRLSKKMWWGAVFSKTLTPFHCVLLGAIIAVMVIILMR